ncbi:TPA: HK97 gp10 family phage protein [Klebsiella quasipneumoniae subsp. quasipneumoniae]|nr:HK97 gp10 family phage protein [Klebsiella aerogenes]HCI6737403.1 HK97 gp10 family phage protein [Klebsiella quasipneumoniae subsp. quasipneumoniae]
MADNDPFVAAVNAFVLRAKENQEQVIRAVSLRILARLVQMSPVDTGRFRGNWLVGFNNAPGGTLEAFDKEGDDTIARESLVIEQFKVGMTAVYFTNNLPYAYPLEFGHSSQAPGGMVRITAAEFQQFFDAAAQEVNP